MEVRRSVSTLDASISKVFLALHQVCLIFLLNQKSSDAALDNPVASIESVVRFLSLYLLADSEPLGFAYSILVPPVQPPPTGAHQRCISLFCVGNLSYSSLKQFRRGKTCANLCFRNTQIRRRFLVLGVFLSCLLLRLSQLRYLPPAPRLFVL